MKLRVKIDSAARKAIFSGDGTFQNKETIKSLGRPRWLAAEKAWEISDFNCKSEELAQIFAHLELDVLLESGGAEDHGEGRLPSAQGAAQDADVFAGWQSEYQPTQAQSVGENYVQSAPRLSMDEIISAASVGEERWAGAHSGKGGSIYEGIRGGIGSGVSGGSHGGNGSNVGVLADCNTGLTAASDAVGGVVGDMIGGKPNYSVAEVMKRTTAVLKRAFSGQFCVYGVINSLKRQGGRVFMELADEQEKGVFVSCVIWGSEETVCQGLNKLGFALEANLQVMFVVTMGINKQGARLSFSVVAMVPEYTVQKVAALREVTNGRLQKEGLFDRNRQVRLPFLPKRLGILTSKGGTVINDFLASLTEANFGFELLWVPINVQGTDAVKQIIQGLRVLGARQDLDAILLFRGGGSQSELAVFNSYELAREICLSPLPVVSAVGHQEDMSSAQDVSNLSFGVPKDLGRFFADRVLELRAGLMLYLQRIVDNSTGEIENRESRVSTLVGYVWHAIRQMLEYREGDLQRIFQGMPALAQGLVRNLGQRFEQKFSTCLLLLFQPVDLRLRDLQRLSLSVMRDAAAQLSGLERLLRQEMRVVSVGLENSVDLAFLKVESQKTVVQRLEQLLTEQQLRVAHFEEIVKNSSVDIQLARGFSLVRNSAGEIVKEAELLATGDEVNIVFAKGSRDAIVK